MPTTTHKKTAVLLVSHGSRFPETVHEIEALVNRLRQAGIAPIVEFAFLELAPPDIAEGIRLCVEQGAGEVIVTLNFLNAGRHVHEDIPGIVGQCADRYPEVAIRMTEPVGQHEGIVRLFAEIVRDPRGPSFNHPL